MMADFREIGADLRAVRAAGVGAARRRGAGAGDGRLAAQARALYDAGMKLGLKALGQGRALLAGATLLLFRALRDRLGFSRLRSAATGGAALGPETFRFFQAMGVPLRQLYGQTETARRLHHPPAGRGRLRHGRRALRREHRAPHRRARRATGWARSSPATRNMFHGLSRRGGDGRTCATAGCTPAMPATSTRPGTSSSSTASRTSPPPAAATGSRPQFIENKLKFSPYVAEAVVLGDGRPHLAAMICIRFPIVSKWAERNRISFTTYTDLSARPQVLDLLRAEVETGERHPAAGAAHPRLPPALQGARRGRRGADPHPQGAPRRDQRRNTATSSTRIYARRAGASRWTPPSPSRTARSSASARR